MPSLLKSLIEAIFNRPVNSCGEEDIPLLGMLKLAEILVLKFPGEIDDRKAFLGFLLGECLFRIENGALTDEARYNSSKIRKAAIDLLFSMVGQNWEGEEMILVEHMEKVMKRMKWRGFSRKSWSLSYNQSNSVNARTNRR